jgi:hypothetical protein
VVVVVEFLHIVFSTHTTYTILALGFADPRVLTNSPFSGAALPALNGTGESLENLLLLKV